MKSRWSLIIFLGLFGVKLPSAAEELADLCAKEPRLPHNSLLHVIVIIILEIAIGIVTGIVISSSNSSRNSI